MSYSPCAACARHVKDGEACPFCGDTQPRVAARKVVAHVVTRAAFVMGSVALGAGCESSPPTPPPITVAPAYGAPAVTAPEPSTTAPAPTTTAPAPTTTAPATTASAKPVPPVTVAPAYGAPMAAYGAPPVPAPKPAPTPKK